MPYMFGYTGATDEKLQKFIEESVDTWNGNTNPPQSIVGSAVGVHAGPGAVVIAFFKQ